MAYSLSSCQSSMGTSSFTVKQRPEEKGDKFLASCGFQFFENLRNRRFFHFSTRHYPGVVFPFSIPLKEARLSLNLGHDHGIVRLEGHDKSKNLVNNHKVRDGSMKRLCIVSITLVALVGSAVGLGRVSGFGPLSILTYREVTSCI